MPLQTSSAECVKQSATTYQSNQQQTKPNQKGKKIKCKVPIITRSCRAQPQSASTMNDELQNKSWRTQTAQLIWQV
jgi:Tfp pilus assembly protein PilV